MTIDIRAKSFTDAIDKMAKEYKFDSCFRIPNTNIYRFCGCEERPKQAKEIDYKKAEKKFLVFNTISNG